eukprot:5682893-Pyramimonas_sp.AAC.1
MNFHLPRPSGATALPSTKPSASWSKSSSNAFHTGESHELSALRYDAIVYLFFFSDPSPTIDDQEMMCALLVFVTGPASAWTEQGIERTRSATDAFFKNGCLCAQSLAAGRFKKDVQKFLKFATSAPRHFVKCRGIAAATLASGTGDCSASKPRPSNNSFNPDWAWGPWPALATLTSAGWGSCPARVISLMRLLEWWHNFAADVTPSAQSSSIPATNSDAIGAPPSSATTSSCDKRWRHPPRDCSAVRLLLGGLAQSLLNILSQNGCGTEK